MFTVGKLTARGDLAASIDFDGARCGRMPERHPVRSRTPQRRAFMLEVHAQARGDDVQVFPVVSFGPDHCMAETTRALDLGASTPVNLVEARRVVRRANARVIEVIPWVAARGQAGFRCRMVLETTKRRRAPDRTTYAEHPPGVEKHDGAQFSLLVAFYQRAGLLSEVMLSNLRSTLALASAAWRRLHCRRSTVAFTLVCRGANQGIEAAISGVRAWDRTCLIQHYASIPGADRRAAGRLNIACAEGVMRQRDTDHIAYFVRADNVAMNSFMEKFLALGGTHEAASRNTLSLWALRHDKLKTLNGSAPSSVLRRAGAQDAVLLSRGAERLFGAIASTALSLVPGKFNLPATDRSYTRLGLQRRRSIAVIMKDGEVRAVLMKEYSTPGINLTGMLNAWWYLPMRTGGTIDELSLQVTAAEIARPSGDRSAHVDHDRLLIVPHTTVSAPLLSAGFEKVLDAHLYVLNRSGLHRYLQYASDRYGELNKLLARREARRAGSAG
jgi:hypothetical protein